MSSITFYIFFVFFLAFVLLAINFIFAPNNPYQEKNSAFECGFHSFLGQNRTQFTISFFVFALLFLLFDLEILLVYPYVVSAYSNGIYGLVIMLIFFLVLTLGFAFELGKKALNIDTRQSSFPKNNGNTLFSLKFIYKSTFIGTNIRHYSNKSNPINNNSILKTIIKKFIRFLLINWYVFAISFMFTLFFRIPLRFMLSNLDILYLLPVFSGILAMLSFIILYNLKLKSSTFNFNIIKCLFVGVIATITGIILHYLSSNDISLLQLCSNLVIDTWALIRIIQAPMTMGGDSVSNHINMTKVINSPLGKKGITLACRTSNMGGATGEGGGTGSVRGQVSSKTERTSHVNKVVQVYNKQVDEIFKDETLTSKEKRVMIDRLAATRDNLSTKSSSSYSNEERLNLRLFYSNSLKKIEQDSSLTDAQKSELSMKLMAEERVEVTKEQIADLDSSWHHKKHKSLDEVIYKKPTKGIPRDITAPDLGNTDRAQVFEGKGKEKAREQDVQVTSPTSSAKAPELFAPFEGLEKSLTSNTAKAPEAVNSFLDLEPDRNLLSAQENKSLPEPARKRDKIKNFFKKK